MQLEGSAHLGGSRTIRKSTLRSVSSLWRKAGFRMEIASTCRRIAAKLASPAGILLALAGCSGTVSDDISLEAVQSQGEGIIIIAASFPEGQVCTDLVLHVSRTVDGKRRTDGFNASSLFRGDSPAQAKLKAGSYELSNMTCHSGNVRLVLHKRDDPIWKRLGAPPPVYARFTVAPGEVVNLGHVTIKWASLGFAELAVSNLSAKHRAWLKENRPKLSGRMVTRLMKPTKHQVIQRKRQSGFQPPPQAPNKRVGSGSGANPYWSRSEMQVSMSHNASNEHSWTIEELSGFLYETVASDVPEGWDRIEIEAKLGVVDDRKSIEVGYRYFLPGDDRPHRFQTTNIFGPMNAISEIEKLMAARGQGWSNGRVIIYPDGRVSIRPQ